MTDRRQEKEVRRAERVAAEAKQAKGQRRRTLLAYVGAGVLVALIVGALVYAIASGGDGAGNDTTGGGGEDLSPELAYIQTQSGYQHGVPGDGRQGTAPPPVQQADLAKAAEAAGCELGLDLEDEGSQHIGPDAEDPEYGTDPPTSGTHDAEQQADGAYREMPAFRHTVHSLEHGRIAIQYSPSLPEENQLALKGFFDEDPAGLLLFPNDDMSFEVATTAWTQMMTCDSWEGDATLDAVRAFRDIYIGRGPEQVPIYL